MGSDYQGAWQQQSQQGAWQEQSVDYEKTWSDSISFSDSLVMSLGKSFSDRLVFNDAPFVRAIQAWPDFAQQYKADAANASVCDIGTEDFSISLWVINERASLTPMVIGKRADGAGGTQPGWAVRATTTYYELYIEDADGDAHNFTTNVLTVTKWNHVAFTVDRDGNITKYVNGVSHGSEDVSLYAASLSNASILKMAKTISGISYHFDGKIVDARIWVGGIWSQPEIEYQYKNPGTTDASAGSFTEQWLCNEGSGLTIAGTNGNDLTLDSTAVWVQADEDLDFAIGKNVSESFSISDAITKAVGKNVSESLSISDVISKGFGKNVSETLSFSDVLTQAFGKNFSDSITFTDAKIITLDKVFSDTLSLSDVFGVGSGLIFSDTFGISDAVVLGVGKTFADNITFSDTISFVQALAKSFTDNFSMSDAVIFSVGKGLADTLGISDAVGLGVGISFSDSIAFTDALTVAGVFQLYKSFTESFGISDSLVKSFGKSFSDIMTLADSLYKALAYGAEHLGNKEIARILADPSAETAPWMTYVAIGESDVAEDEVHDTALYDEIHRKAGEVWVVRNTFFIKATFGQDEPTGDGYTIKEVGIFDDPTAGILGRRWVLDAPVGKDNLDEIVVECAITILRGTITAHASGLTETMGFSDSLSMSMAFGRSFSDNLQLSDSFSYSHVKAWPPAPVFNDVVVEGNYLYAAYEDATEPGGGVVTYDISDKTSPSRGGWLHITGTQADAPKRIVKQGNYIYMSYRSGVITVDVTNPLDPSLGDIASPGGPYAGVPTVAIAGTRLYFVGQGAGLHRYDATTPTSISLVETMDHGNRAWDSHVGGVSFPFCSLGGAHGNVMQSSNWLYTDGTYLYVESDDLSVWIMNHTANFHNDAAPTVNGSLVDLYSIPASKISNILAVAGSGSTVYIYGVVSPANAAYGYSAARRVNTGWFNNSDIVANANVGALAAPPNGYSKFVIDGTEGYILGLPGVVILTLSTGAILNTLASSYRGHDVNSGYLYIAEDVTPGQVLIYDVSTPATPVLVGTAT